jgi:hypothetical protein
MSVDEVSGNEIVGEKSAPVRWEQPGPPAGEPRAPRAVRASEASYGFLSQPVSFTRAGRLPHGETREACFRFEFNTAYSGL